MISFIINNSRLSRLPPQPQVGRHGRKAHSRNPALVPRPLLGSSPLSPLACILQSTIFPRLQYLHFLPVCIFIGSLTSFLHDMFRMVKKHNLEKSSMVCTDLFSRQYISMLFVHYNVLPSIHNVSILIKMIFLQILHKCPLGHNDKLFIFLPCLILIISHERSP